ncbi:MAG: hypothetical protein IPH84_02690 [Bacteroidales bacterium]|nr:hypothetical protein [Bacteroidales bacterium]
MEDNYNLLIRKIDEFIRKYYKNQLLKGVLYSVASLGFFYIILVLLEYFSWYNTITRSVFFYLFIGICLLIVSRYILWPYSKWVRIGKIISHEEAARIIGVHFGEVRDRLINTLQLKDSVNEFGASKELIEASIDQKIAQLNPVPFSEAVNLAENRKYLRYALPPLVFILAALLISPSLITGPSQRIIQHGRIFEKPSKFIITILNPKLQAIQQDDFLLRLKVTGDEVPDQLYIETGGAKYKMDKENPISFNYTFKNLQQNTAFVITADLYNSKEYEISILPKPMILSFDIKAQYPSYLNRKSEDFNNNGDLTIPEGSTITWKFYTRDTRKIKVRFGDKTFNLEGGNSNTFQFTKQVLSASDYSILSSNEFFISRDSLAYSINVIPDLYPSIDVDEFKDSIYDSRLYFKGVLKDDYGIQRLIFHSSIKRAGQETAGEAKEKEITVDRSINQQQFYYFLDISTLYVSPGDEIEYFFEVWDNDGIHGNKSTRSQMRVFKVPTLEEIEKETEKKNEDIKDKMEQVMQQSQVLQKQIDDMARKMVDKKEIGWQEKQQLKQLLDKHAALKQQVEEIQKENTEKSRQEQQYKEISPELVEKQKQLEKLFQEILPEEMKKMMEEMQKLMEKVDKDKVSQMLEKMKLDNKDLEKQLDRSLELFKQLEFEKKLQETIDKLSKITEEQNKLEKETREAEKEESQKLLDQQEKLNEEFNKLKEDLDDLQKKNEALEKPNDLEKTKPEEESIQQEMNNSKENLKQNKNKAASQSQKKASESMEKLGAKLEKMQEQMEEEADAEDEAALREILDNLVKISFKQEDLMDKLGEIGTNNPKFLKIIEDQNNLKDDLKMVEDSLFAISKRQPMIEPFIMREIASINKNVGDATKSLNDRSVPVAKGQQQYIMTSVNNLALMLSESLKQMQKNQNKGKGSSNGSCNKPGGAGDKMKSMRQMQDRLNKQLQQMKEGMNKPGGQKGQKQLSEQLARMAAQQEALRKQMQEFGDEIQMEGSGTDKLLKEMMQRMEQTETDLVNKRITQETLLRQQEILTRMLESEKAMQQRELEEKRESNEAKDIFYNNPSKFFEYKKIKEKENEMIRTVPPTLKPFYKGKVNTYFLSFE